MHTVKLFCLQVLLGGFCHMLGLKRGTVQLCEHEKAWEDEAKRTIERLWGILGSVATDIQHVGSTSIVSIKAKPIIDIAVSVNDFKAILVLEDELKAAGFYYREDKLDNQLLFACGSVYDGTGDLQTHFIHVVLKDSMEWRNYINFRNYMNSNHEAAKAYERLKEALVANAPVDAGRVKYTAGKHEFIVNILKTAAEVFRE